MLQRFHKAEAVERQMGFANAVRHRDLLFISGAVSWDAALQPLHPGDMAGQMGEVYGYLATFLNEFGTSFDNVVRETVYVTNLDQALAHAAVRRGFFGRQQLPAATWVEVARLIHPDLVIEVEMTVLVGDPPE